MTRSMEADVSPKFADTAMRVAAAVADRISGFDVDEVVELARRGLRVQRVIHGWSVTVRRDLADGGPAVWTITAFPLRESGPEPTALRVTLGYIAGRAGAPLTGLLAAAVHHMRQPDNYHIEWREAPEEKPAP